MMILLCKLWFVISLVTIPLNFWSHFLTQSNRIDFLVANFWGRLGRILGALLASIIPVYHILVALAGWCYWRQLEKKNYLQTQLSLAKAEIIAFRQAREDYKKGRK